MLDLRKYCFKIKTVNPSTLTDGEVHCSKCATTEGTSFLGSLEMPTIGIRGLSNNTSSALEEVTPSGHQLLLTKIGKQVAA